MIKQKYLFLFMLYLAAHTHLHAAQMNVETKKQQEDQLTTEGQALVRDMFKIFDATNEENRSEKDKELQNLFQQHQSILQETKAVKRMFEIIWGTNRLNKAEQAARLQNLLQQYPRIINQRNEAGDTALMFSIRHHVNEMAQILINAGANLNLRNLRTRDPDYTALIMAVKEDMQEIIPALITETNIDLQDIYGNTALHYAARTKNKNIVQMLIAAGANKNMRNNFGDTAFDNAIEKKFGDEYLAAVETGEKERQRYEQAQQTAKTELKKHMISPLAQLTTEYAYHPQVLADLPETPLEKAQRITKEIREKKKQKALNCKIKEKR